MNTRLGYVIGMVHGGCLWTAAKLTPDTKWGLIVVLAIVIALAVPVEWLLTHCGRNERRRDLDLRRDAIRVRSLRQSLEQIADADMTEPEGRYYRLATEALAPGG